MSRLLFLFFIALLTPNLYSQAWKGYFSYNNVRFMSVGQNKVYASAENAYFSKHLLNDDVKTVNTVDGLSGQNISAFYHNKQLNRTFVGYENGLIIMINENDNNVRRFSDVINKDGIPPNQKRINSFYEFENKLYIAAAFGIVVLDLNTFLFKDTFFMGPGGQQINVFNAVVFQNQIFAVTQLHGIRAAEVSNPNLIDFNLWSTFDGGSWLKAVVFEDQLIGLNSDGIIYRYNGNFFTPFFNFGATNTDVFPGDGFLAACSVNRAVLFNSNFAPIINVPLNQFPEATLSLTSVALVNNQLYVGTSGNGVFQTSSLNPGKLNQILPDGPSRNKIFGIQVAPSGSFLWTVYGEHTQAYNPFPLDSYGVSKYSENGWLNIPYSEVSPAKSIVRAFINPSNENQVYFSSFYSGILKFDNNGLVQVFNENSPNGPESIGYDPLNPDIRINGSAMDRNGNIWFNNSRIDNALKVLRANGQWQSYSIANFSNFPAENSYGKMQVDRNGTKWFVSSREGVFGFNENMTPTFRKVTVENQTGFPFTDTRALAIDNRNQLWIGSVGGLRVMPSVDRFMNAGDLISRPIIIVEDGLAQELLADQYITAIAVDGANNKWIGTADAGIFQVSPNGQQTLQRFNQTNSPLPSNTVRDIDINGVTGEVFFVTDRGMVSFQGTATDGKRNFNDVVVYPNPVRPGFTGTVKITGLVDRANVKITDIEGNLVHEQTAPGGTIEWDTTAFGKYKVASGVYMIFLSTEDGLETKVKKIMIVR
jgi:hypothetical protein